MKAIKQWLKTPTAAVVALVLAGGLIVFSGITGARAYQRYESNTLAGRVQMQDIGVSLMENDEKVSYRDYDSSVADGTWKKDVPGVLLSALPDNPVLGKEYEERLWVENSGSINEYVRVTIYKYWLDQDEKKLTTLSPDYIRLNLVNLDTDWILDTEASTEERTVLYYSRLLEAGTPTPLFADKIAIDNFPATAVTEKPDDEDPTLIHIYYDYDGISFCLDVRVDAVQEHNAQDAAVSAWGNTYVVIDNNAKTLQLSQ